MKAWEYVTGTGGDWDNHADAGYRRRRSRMKYYEKAIAEFTKECKKYYKQALQDDIERFTAAALRMHGQGTCLGLSCSQCPIHMYRDDGGKPTSCGIASNMERKEIANMEVPHD